MDYYPLFNVEEIEDGSALTIPRMQAVYTACLRHRDFEVLQLCRQTYREQTTVEIAVVEVTCDGVPPRNDYGIEYRERLALCVPTDPKTLVEVLALRKTFPVLMHQNSRPTNAPASLCLYFEPLPVVLRTWTPEQFLRRIQWWMEKTARGDLHPADQPVEQLFFASKYELVLPWNFEALQQGQDQSFIVLRGDKRPDGGETLFLRPTSDAGAGQKAVSPIEVTIDPVTHGHVARDPDTLGELTDMLNARGVDFLSKLKDAVQQRVGQDGMEVSADDRFTVILLHIPVRRTQEAQPETLSTRAFVLTTGMLRLGEALGALFVHENKFYNEVTGALAPAAKTDWMVQQLFPMQVHHFNHVKVARQQSGIEEAGPAGLLVGAGSLGSALLNLWGRSGWGTWTVVDKDHIKPHNLVRHTAVAQHVGEMKPHVVAELHAAVMGSASQVTPLCADVLDEMDEELTEALHAAALVVDASTTLEYPRRVSELEGVGRHLSVFITPSGNAAVLLAEDASRTIRLRALEAQYYRALIQADWGATHLDGHLGTFWSGAGCRDISTVLPYSRILAHAATLAEQVQWVTNQSEAHIRIWSRDPELGSVTAHTVPVHLERRLDFGDFDLFIDQGVEQVLREQRAQHAPHETGGVLVGYHDFNENAVIIVDALPAPPDSASTPASFVRGAEGLREAIENVSRRTGEVVQYIGEWHSHPPGHSANPSQDDLYQLVYLSMGMAEDGLSAISLIVGEDDIQIMKARVQT